MRLAGHHVNEIGEQVCLVIPAWSSAVEVRHQRRFAWEPPKSHPHLAKGETSAAILVESPQVRQPKVVILRKVGLHLVAQLVVTQKLEEARYSPASPPSSLATSLNSSSVSERRGFGSETVYLKYVC